MSDSDDNLGKALAKALAKFGLPPLSDKAAARLLIRLEKLRELLQLDGRHLLWPQSAKKRGEAAQARVINIEIFPFYADQLTRRTISQGVGGANQSGGN
jgi:hypothetical protein